MVCHAIAGIVLMLLGFAFKIPYPWCTPIIGSSTELPEVKVKIQLWRMSRESINVDIRLHTKAGLCGIYGSLCLDCSLAEERQVRNQYNSTCNVDVGLLE